MRLNNFLIESRTKEITEEDFLEAVKTKCQEALKAPPIYRGTGPMKYSFISPRRHERKSANSYNWYTLILNNSPKWSSYPKRSLICTTSRVTAISYGYAVRVFPVDGAKIGVCLSDDLWSSFSKIKYHSAVESLNDFSSLIQKILLAANPGKKILDDNLNQLKYFAKNVGEWYKKNIKSHEEEVWKKFGNSASRLLPLNYLKEKNFDGEDFYKFLDDLLDPRDNGFKLYTINSLPMFREEREIWTDADCYMIRDDIFKEKFGGELL